MESLQKSEIVSSGSSFISEASSADRYLLHFQEVLHQTGGLHSYSHPLAKSLQVQAFVEMQLDVENQGELQHSRDRPYSDQHSLLGQTLRVYGSTTHQLRYCFPEPLEYPFQLSQATNLLSHKGISLSAKESLD